MRVDHFDAEGNRTGHSERRPSAVARWSGRQIAFNFWMLVILLAMGLIYSAVR